MTRARVFTGSRLWAHFRVLSLCAAGRDEGPFRFESKQLVEQIAFYVRLVQEVAQLDGHLSEVRVAVTDLTEGHLSATPEDQVLRPLSDRLTARLRKWPSYHRVDWRWCGRR